MWFLFALLTFFAWGGADLFYKKGADEGEKYSHLKTSIAVGLIMGISAVVTLLTSGIEYDIRNLLVYLPVSLSYILSMTVGYFGLRYLEVSISSPIQNASGAVSAILLMIFASQLPDTVTAIGTAIITVGVILLGVAERKNETEYLRENDSKYKIGFVAFLMPIFYCIIDSIGTFLDGIYLDIDSSKLIGVTEDNIEDVANISYQLTFLIVALILFVYVYVIKREKLRIKGNGNRLIAAGLETGGQLSYVYAMSGNPVAAAPMIASYCVASMLLGRIFLKEKLKPFQYFAAALVVLGIILLGIVEGLAE